MIQKIDDESLIQQFIEYLLIERGLSYNTIISYQRDLKDFVGFIEKSPKNVSILEVDHQHIIKYLTYLSEKGLATSTMDRRMDALRTFYKFMVMERYIKSSPAEIVEYIRA